MKVLIIGGKNYSNKRIAKELKLKGHDVAITDQLKYTLKISDKSGHDRVYYNDQRIFANTIAAIIPRVGRNFDFGCSVVQHINENMKIYSPSTSSGLKNASDKYLCTQLLSKSKLKVPKTLYFQKPDNYAFLIDQLGGYPVVAKLLTGSQGAGVFILNDDVAGSTALGTIAKSHKVLLQEYIETAKQDENKCDIRAWVVGNEVVASMKRFAVDKDFRSNYSISKSAESITLTADQKAFAVSCAKSVGLEFAGVDLMIDISDNTVYCIEVNGNASLAGIEKVTKINVAEKIAAHMVLAIQMNHVPANQSMSLNLNIDNEDQNDITRDYLSPFDDMDDFDVEDAEMSAVSELDSISLAVLQRLGKKSAPKTVDSWLDGVAEKRQEIEDSTAPYYLRNGLNRTQRLKNAVEKSRMARR